MNEYIIGLFRIISIKLYSYLSMIIKTGAKHHVEPVVSPKLTVLAARRANNTHVPASTERNT
jgi:hypothetical protein